MFAGVMGVEQWGPNSVDEMKKFSFSTVKYRPSPSLLCGSV